MARGTTLVGMARGTFPRGASRAAAKSALTELALAAGCSASKFGLAADDDSKDSDDEREPLLAAAAARARADFRGCAGKSGG